MVVDRIERHDVVNAVLLAAVLLLFAFGIVTAFGSLQSTVDEGLITATKEPELGSETTAVEGATTEPETTATTELTVSTRPAVEVTVRIANGARRAGVAGAGTEQVQAAGYPTLSPKNGPTSDDSVVYYASGYAADAVAVAEVLGLDPTAIEPMPSDPGVPIEGAHVIVILGVSAPF